MKTPDTPRDEDSRLTVLRSLNILDTPAEERFDRLTRLAKRIFGVPIALVSLVDEKRQWFKSCVGLPVRETSRDISFCGHSILGNEIFVIADATKDPRFLDNPLVLDEPKIRFYAGCPLTYLDGSNLGTLCIIDKKPRTLSEDDLEALKDLAMLAERELVAVQLAILDDLTKISNRRGFLALAQHSLNICIRKGVPASLVYFDLNQFKLINDKFGHAEGDFALTTFADQMKRKFRNSDVFARLGGDEFVVFLSDTSIESAERIIARFRQSLERYNKKINRGYDISFCDGTVTFERNIDGSIEALLTRADSLMYKKKHDHSGRCCK